MEVLAILTFLTVAFLFLRGKYLRSPLGDHEPQSRREHLLRGAEVLQEQGYRIVGERIAHEVASYYGSRKFVSYIVVDYLAEKEGLQYPVKVRSPRDPDRMSGARLRRQFLTLYTLYETPIAYVNPYTGMIDLVDFALDYPGRTYRRRWRMRLLWLSVGVALGWLLSLSH
ncbi:MAG: hypothetical protein ACYCYO_09965 [Bacilli bacterium]